MKAIVYQNRVVLAFSDSADLSQWPLVNDGGQLSNISNVPGPPFVVSVAIPLTVPVSSLIYNGSTVVQGAVIPLPSVNTTPRTEYVEMMQSRVDALNAKGDYLQAYLLQRTFQ